MTVAQYKWTVVDDVIIAIGTDGKLPEEAWKAFVHEMDTKSITKYLQVVIGSIEVSSVQRKHGIDVVNKRGIKVSVVNDSPIVRGIVTAASWFGVDIKSFTLSELREAVRWLGVPLHRESAVVAAAEKLRASVL